MVVYSSWFTRSLDHWMGWRYLHKQGLQFYCYYINLFLIVYLECAVCLHRQNLTALNTFCIPLYSRAKDTEETLLIDFLLFRLCYVFSARKYPLHQILSGDVIARDLSNTTVPLSAIQVTIKSKITILIFYGMIIINNLSVQLVFLLKMKCLFLYMQSVCSEKHKPRPLFFSFDSPFHSDTRQNTEVKTIAISGLRGLYTFCNLVGGIYSGVSLKRSHTV